ncbi:DNase I-like protein [Hyaloscypha variabilis F]|uniref:DNA-(apurinic or apyrimidinic site) endonuclease 2 n=1 Tax=Hyaloscypha variabilis (strain UAMH 11265 / GT02V1 / F) TaxID=1149755 RepID=A0A2J6S6M6_HYAVF|nr:DNase I-like protein [Hyaloscypha variabilis F]
MNYQAMFKILEADIVVMQETKIQRKDLQDDMVLVPGWDVFFSLPKYKKGYSGVAIYTRNAVCAPIRAEEGITGVLTPPNSLTSFFNLPKHEQIGGYPTQIQLSECTLDAATLDSEGRCVILEFPAFVLIGVYCPANRDETRDEFRIGFLNALDARVRNLTAAGKKVFLTGDMNIIREEIDTAKAEEQARKQSITLEQYISTPARRLFNQLLVGGKVIGDRDEGREAPVLWDICRGFHPARRGMFTCWEQKINARPGNFGSRIDYVLCSIGCQEWFSDSNIQEGLMGSDHCPVYAVLKQNVVFEGNEVDIRDIMSAGIFKGGVRQREWSNKDLLPLSAKLIPEFDRRRSIRDMFSKQPPLQRGESFLESKSASHDQDGKLFGSTDRDTVSGETVTENVENNQDPHAILDEILEAEPSSEMLIQNTDSSVRAKTASSPLDSQTALMPSPARPSIKRSNEASATARPQKRGKANSSSKGTATASKALPGKGQSSLMGFFKPKTPQRDSASDSQLTIDNESDNISYTTSDRSTPALSMSDSISINESDSSFQAFNLADQKSVVDPIVAKESWSKLLGKRVVPRCEHNEPCVSFVTKKPGVNCGRSFYMCPRPLGPSGQKEKNTQWRCGTFIWSSDWTGD